MSGSALHSHHTCFLVADLAVAIEEFSAIGIAFGPSRVASLQVQNGTGEETEEISLVFSLDGAVELIEATDREDGLFSRSRGLGFHHLGGIPSESLESGVSQQQTSGAEVGWHVRLDGIPLAVYFKPTSRRPMIVELLSPDLRPTPEAG